MGFGHTTDACKITRYYGRDRHPHYHLPPLTTGRWRVHAAQQQPHAHLRWRVHVHCPCAICVVQRLVLQRDRVHSHAVGLPSASATVSRSSRSERTVMTGPCKSQPRVGEARGGCHPCVSEATDDGGRMALPGQSVYLECLQIFQHILHPHVVVAWH